MYGQRLRNRIGGGHGPAPYQPAGDRARTSHRVLGRLLAAGLLLFVGASSVAEAAPRPRRLAPSRQWRSFEIRSPGDAAVFMLPVVGGCRYRIDLDLKSLSRAILEVGPPGASHLRLDTAEAAGDGEGPEDDEPQPPSLDWYAESDGAYEARVSGFSAHTGRARIRFQTIGPAGKPVSSHERILAPGGTLAQVGELWIGEENRWALRVRAGHTYEIRTRPGTAGPVLLEVLDGEGRTLAEAGPTVVTPYPWVRFALPDGLSVDDIELVVRGLRGGGGTYGVRLAEDPQLLSPPDEVEPSPVEAGLVEGEPLTFRANPGDVALLFVETSSPFAPHTLVALEDGVWKPVGVEMVSPWGERASMRTPENAAVVWFRAHRPGTYRFLEPSGAKATLEVATADRLGGAPLLIGTGLDPEVPARAASGWKTVGVGVCMPGWDYLYVAVGTHAGGGVGMRVQDLDGKTVRQRDAATGGSVRGMGPSLRFQVEGPMFVHLQVRGARWQGFGLLRRASN